MTRFIPLPSEPNKACPSPNHDPIMHQTPPPYGGAEIRAAALRDFVQSVGECDVLALDSQVISGLYATRNHGGEFDKTMVDAEFSAFPSLPPRNRYSGCWQTLPSSCLIIASAPQIVSPLQRDDTVAPPPPPNALVGRHSHDDILRDIVNAQRSDHQVFMLQRNSNGKGFNRRKLHNHLFRKSSHDV